MATAYTLGIAGYYIAVHFEADHGGLNPALAPFLLPPLPSGGADLTVEFLHDGVPEETSLPSALLEPGEIMSVSRHEAGLLFRRREGKLLANSDFSFCRVWNTAGSNPPEPFTGLPWLALALWGYMAHRGGALPHGALCELEGRFVLLLGRPEAGKSTLSRLVVAEGGACLTDEYPLLTWHEPTVWAHGTPWYGIWGTAARLSAPLRAIFFLRHAPTNVLQRLDAREGARRLLQNVRFFRWDRGTIPDTVALVDRTARTVPIYDFGFLPEPSAVQSLREVL